MALVDEMAKTIEEQKDAFHRLNNSDDPRNEDILLAIMQQSYRDLRDLLDRYNNGER